MALLNSMSACGQRLMNDRKYSMARVRTGASLPKDAPLAVHQQLVRPDRPCHEPKALSAQGPTSPCRLT